MLPQTDSGLLCGCRATPPLALEIQVPWLLVFGYKRNWLRDSQFLFWNSTFFFCNFLHINQKLKKDSLTTPYNDSKETLGPWISSFQGKIKSLIPIGFYEDKIKSYTRSSLTLSREDIFTTVWLLSLETLCSTLSRQDPLIPVREVGQASVGVQPSVSHCCGPVIPPCHARHCLDKS